MSTGHHRFLESLTRSGWVSPEFLNELAKDIGRTNHAQKSLSAAARRHPDDAKKARLIHKIVSEGFDIADQIGAGGMGIVFKATDTDSNVHAIKAINYDALPTMGGTAVLSELTSRFDREMRISGNVVSHNVVSCTATYPDGEYPFFAMPLIVGSNLRAIVENGGPMSVAASIRYVRDIAQGLRAIHNAHQLIHRDITPQNVIVRQSDDAALILDLGTARRSLVAKLSLNHDTIAELTRGNMLIGTPGYMAPETSLYSRNVTYAADIYSLACVWFFMLSGRRPFKDFHRDHEPVAFPAISLERSDIPEGIQTLLSEMSTVDSNGRIQSGADLVARIEAICGDVKHQIASVTSSAPTCAVASVDDSVLVPNFLLFERRNELVLAIVDSRCRVDSFCLQKSHYSRERSKLVSAERLAILGFDAGRVHPFIESAKTVSAVIVDSSIMALSMLFPSMRIQIPKSNSATDPGCIEVCGFLDILRQLHGPKLWPERIICQEDWPKSLLFRLLRERPIRTRFAPTPSNSLHIGGVRTAMLSFLASKLHPSGDFILRFDDTDFERSATNAVERIREELRWLGIDWEEQKTFAQRDSKALERYEKTEKLLQLANLIVQEGADDDQNLAPLTSNGDLNYYNIVIDITRGPIVIHRPPSDRGGQPRTIRLVRGTRPKMPSHPIENVGDDAVDDNRLVRDNRQRKRIPFYRFAGAVDDMLDANIVFRDARQCHLTEVQSHIISGVEQARAITSTEDWTRAICEKLGLDADTPFPRPAYCHVPVVVDSRGRPLSKRNSGPDTSVAHLRHVKGIRPEAILAYWASSILSRSDRLPPLTFGERLATIAARVGRHRFLDLTARELTLDTLMTKRMYLTFSFRTLQHLNRIVLRTVPYWRFRRWIRESVDETVSPCEITALFNNVGWFSDFAEITSVLQEPAGTHVVDVVDREFFLSLATEDFYTAGMRGESVEEDKVQSLFESLYEQVFDTGNTHCPRATIRRALMDRADGPPLSVLFAILGPHKTIRRIARYMCRCGFSDDGQSKLAGQSQHV